MANSGFSTKFCMHCYFLYAWYMSHPLHPLSFDCPKSVWWTAQINKLLIMQLPFVLLLLRLSQVQTFSSTPVLKHLQSVIPWFKCCHSNKLHNNGNRIRINLSILLDCLSETKQNTIKVSLLWKHVLILNIIFKLSLQYQLHIIQFTSHTKLIML